MIFERGDLKVIAPLDPIDGRRYVNLVREEVDNDDVKHYYLYKSIRGGQ